MAVMTSPCLAKYVLWQRQSANPLHGGKENTVTRIVVQVVVADLIVAVDQTKGHGGVTETCLEYNVDDEYLVFTKFFVIELFSVNVFTADIIQSVCRKVIRTGLETKWREWCLIYNHVQCWQPLAPNSTIYFFQQAIALFLFFW